MAYPPPLVRAYNFARLVADGIDDDVAAQKLDVELNRILAGHNQALLVLRGITTAAGALRSVPSATSLSLSSSTRFSATAGQTAFTVPTYAHGVDTVEVWYGAGAGLSMLDPASVAQTSDTVVTIPAQALGNIVVILVFSSGSATLATLAVDGTAGGTSGATLVGLFGDGLFISHTVEGGLVELMTQYNATVAALGAISGLIRSDGSVAMAADLPMAGFKVTGAAAAVAPGELVEYSQFATFANVWNALQAFYLKLDGTSTMTANLLMGGFKITGGAAGVAPTDFAVVSQLGSVAPAAQSLTPAQMDPTNGGVFQAGKNAIINGGCLLTSHTAAYVAAVSGTYGYGLVDLIQGALIGTAVGGTLTQGNSATPGSTGVSAWWSNVTLTGAGQVKWRVFIEAASARRFTRRNFSIGAKVSHGAGAPVNFSISVYNATVADTFAATTLIGASTPQSVPNGSEVHLKFENIAANPNAKLGLMIEVTADCGAVTTKNFFLADFQCETGDQATFLECEDIQVTRAKAARFYQKSYEDGVYAGVATLSEIFNITPAINGVELDFTFPVVMRIAPTVGVYSPVTGTAAKFRNYTTGADVAGAAVAGTKRFYSASATLASNIYAFAWTADARF